MNAKCHDSAVFFVLKTNCLTNKNAENKAEKKVTGCKCIAVDMTRYAEATCAAIYTNSCKVFDSSDLGTGLSSCPSKPATALVRVGAHSNIILTMVLLSLFHGVSVKKIDC